MRLQAGELGSVSRPVMSQVSGCLVLFAVTYAVAGAAATDDLGTICVAPLPSAARAMDHEYPGGKAPHEYTYDFSIQVDEQRPVALSQTEPLLISGLEIRKEHRVRVRDRSKVIESFSFTFKSRGSTKLCLSYTPWYQTWSLEKPARRPWCKCRNG